MSNLNSGKTYRNRRCNNSNNVSTVCRLNLPTEHVVDQGYMSLELLLKSRQDYGIDLLGPVPDDNSWQARERGCSKCPKRDCCTCTTRYKRRTLTLLAPQAHFEAQQLARQRQATTDFNDHYSIRAGAEGTMSQAAIALDGRRSRYRGMEKTHFQHVVIATAINLLRAVSWLNQVPRSVTKPSRFAALAA